MKRLIYEIKAQKRFYILVLFIQAMCMLTICFVIGLLLNNEYLSLEADSSTLRFTVELTNEEDAMTAEEMEPMIEEMLEVLKHKYTEVLYSYMYIEETDDDIMMTIVCDWFTPENGKITKGVTYTDTVDVQVTVGDAFTDNDYAETNYKAIVTGSDPYAYGETLSLFGTEYQIIGERHNLNIDSGSVVNDVVICIPATSWENIPVTSFEIQLRCLMTEKNRDALYEILEKWYGDAERYVDDYTADNSDLEAAYRSVFVISAFMLIAAFGVMTMLYGYLFIYKKRKIAISSLCGCSRMRCIWDYTLENLLIGGISTAVGLGIFVLVKNLWLSQAYPYMDDIFTGKMIAACFFGMLALSLVQGFVLALINVKKNVMEMLTV